MSEQSNSESATGSTLGNIVLSLAVTIVSIVLALMAAEFVIRIKNSAMNNYDIEMWRYAKELKFKSLDEALDFDHVRSQHATLQSVEIRLNEYGLRGGPVQPIPENGRRILILGGSIALGWGVPENDTVSVRLEKMLRTNGEAAQVLNGGIGNYNAPRAVARFFKGFADLKPTDILFLYFLRDAEELPPGGGNFLLRHSQLAVTLWIAFHRLFDRSGETSLVEHYRKVYEPNAPGFLAMRSSFKALAESAKKQNVRLYLAMVPDVHNLVNYQFRFVHDIMRGAASEQGYVFIDLLPALLGRTPDDLFAMPGDPHPNALGHRLMAEAIFSVIAKPTDKQVRN